MTAPWSAARCRWTSQAVCVATTALFFMAVQVQGGIPAVEYALDGRTTYCWKSNASVHAEAVDRSSVLRQRVETDCAVAMALTIAKDTLYADEPFDVEWHALLREFTVNGERKVVRPFLVDGLDVVSTHAQTCSLDGTCDPFDDSRFRIQATPAQCGNFTNSRITFRSNQLVMHMPGIFTVSAHLTMGTPNPDFERADYAVFVQVKVHERITPKPSELHVSSVSSQSSAISPAVLALIVIGAIVMFLVAAVFVIRKRRVPSDDDWGLPGRDSRRESRYEAFPGEPRRSDRPAEEPAIDERRISRNRRKSTFLTAMSPTSSDDIASPTRVPIVPSATMLSSSFMHRHRRSEYDIGQVAMLLAVQSHAAPHTVASPESMAQRPRQPAGAKSRIFYNDISEDDVVGGGHLATPPQPMAHGQASTRHPEHVTDRTSQQRPKASVPSQDTAPQQSNGVPQQLHGDPQPQQDDTVAPYLPDHTQMTLQDLFVASRLPLRLSVLVEEDQNQQDVASLKSGSDSPHRDLVGSRSPIAVTTTQEGNRVL